jgi:hypothetical protein
MVNFFRKLHNAFIWFKFGYNNHEWDHIYFYMMLKFKLEKMEKYFRKYGIHTTHYSQARICKLAVAYLDILIEDGANLPIMKQYYLKYPPTKKMFTNIDTISQDLEKYSKTYEFKLFCRVNDRVIKKVKIYKSKLFYLLDNYVEYLWD